MKRCGRCLADRPAELFYRHSAAVDGLSRWCKPCSAEYQRANPRPKKKRYVGDPLLKKANAARYYQAHKVEIEEKRKARKAAAEAQRLARRTSRGAALTAVVAAPRGDVRASVAAMFASAKRKTCTRCKVSALLTAFPKDSSRKDKLGLWCRACCADALRIRKANKREKEGQNFNY